jgi:hypothetical protein
MENNTTGLIAKIRQDIGTGRVPTAEVLKLCERTEELCREALAVEKALHDALKIIEKSDEK